MLRGWEYRQHWTGVPGTSSGHWPDGWQEEGLTVDDRRARELVAAQRERIEAALRNLTGEVRAESDLERQQEGESDSGSELATEMVEDALVARLRDELDAVARAEARIEAGTYGRSVDSGVAIPDERLESEPLAERTVEDQRRVDAAAR
jgi:RNA polymerase-binding transcription factor